MSMTEMYVAQPADTGTPVIRARGIGVDLPGLRTGVLRRRGGPVRCVVGLDVDLYAAEMVWLVGAPGMGAVEAGRVLSGELALRAGTVELDGRDVATMRGRRRAAARREVVGLGWGGGPDLDPKRTPAELVAEAATGSARTVGAEQLAQAEQLLGRLGLGRERAIARTGTLSRADHRIVGAARVVALRPRVVVYHAESQDGSGPGQGPVWAALTELRSEASTALVIVSDELPGSLGPGERALVLCGGRVVEVLGTGDLAHPLHPYTLTLTSSSPGTQAEARSMGRGTAPGIETGGAGCPFRSGCPRAKARCTTEMPRLTRPLGATHDVACHFPEDPRRSPAGGEAGVEDAQGAGSGLPVGAASHPDEPTAREFAEG